MKVANNVTKYRKRKDVNIAYIIFLIIFIYVVTYVSIYFTKEHLSIYEVKEGYTADNNTFNGLILRHEKIITTDSAGYINYYHRDSDRIGKNTISYSVTDEKLSYDLDSENEASLSTQDVNSISKEIFDFKKDYENSDFSGVYDFKYDIENLVLQIMNDNQLSNISGKATGNQTNKAILVDHSKSSGVIAYSMDGYENLDANSITKDNFLQENYNKLSLRTMELVERNSPIYRLVTSDKWYIILSIDNDQYDTLKELKRVKINIGDYSLETTVPITVYESGGEQYAKLALSKYMIQFINQRYVKVELALNAASGLKIPVSSIVEKEFYKVPNDFITEGGDSGSKGVVMEDYTSGDLELNFVPTDIYLSDDTYSYIDARLFKANTYLHSEKTGERLQINATETLKGVFTVNKGYAVFRRIDVIYENEEYCIVEKGTKYGLDVYDHIALVGSTAVEQAIIY